MYFIKMSYYTRPSVVIDNGGYFIKSGFTCDNHPVSIIRTVVGRPKYLNGTYGKKFYDVFVGDEALTQCEDLELSYPIVGSNVVHWDNMERLWHKIYYIELKVAPEDRAVILSVPAQMGMSDKFKACNVFFEMLNAPSLCIQSDSVLAMYGSGLTTGVSVDLGHQIFEVNPVYEGRQLSFAHGEVTKISGVKISNYLKECCLTNRGYDFGPSKNMQILQDIRKNYLFVTENSSFPLKPRIFKRYKLPNGEVIDITEDCYRAVEMIFQPDLVMGWSRDCSLQEIVITTILKCDSDLQDEMFSSIVICGGMAMIPGMGRRLAKEIEAVINRPVNVIETPEAATLPWLGGATFAGIPGAQAIWVTKKEYDEYGDSVLKNRFL